MAHDELLRLRRAVESTTDLITFHARGGRMLFANRAARELIGVGPDDPLPQLEMDEFFETTTEQLAEMREAIIDGGRWAGELLVRGRDLRLPASVVVTGHRDASGRYEYFSAIARDISDQRANEAARRRSETALRAVVQSSPLPIFALDARGTVHVWNHAAEELFGWPASDVVGGPLPFLDSPVELDALIALAFSGETTQSHEARYARRDGRMLDVSVSLAPLRNATGRVVSAVVVVADVSDQRRAELALRESEVRFRSLVQDSSDMITIVGPDGGVMYRSPSASRFVGLDPGELSDAPPDLGLFEDDRSELHAALVRVREKAGASETVRYRFLRHDGELRWIEMIATNHLADDAVRGIVTNCRDITDRVEAEHQVRDSEERMRALLANISDVISVIDADGGLRYSSPSVERVYGYKEGAWPEGQHIFDTVHPDDRHRVFELWEGSLSTRGEFRPLEIRLRKGDGSWIYTEVIANNLLDDPAVNGIVVTSRDITQRKESEEALRASESRLRDSEARYRGVVDDQTELVCRYLPDATLTFTNRAFAEFFGSTSDDLAGVKLVDLRPASERVRTLEWLETFESGETVRTHVEREVSLDGSLRWYQWTDRAFANDAGEIVEFQSVGHDITDQRRAAEFTVHQAEILEQVARGVALDETLLTIARALEDQFPRFSCAIMLVDAADADIDKGATLRGGVAPTLATRVFESLDGTPIAASSCSSGAAAYSREAVYVRDVTSDDRWADHREIVLEHGLRAAWSVPILAGDGGAVLGTLDVFVPEPRLPDDEHRQIFVLLAQLASIAIERKAFEERLAHQSMHDPLTGLPNRLLFLDRLSQAIARCRRTQSSVGVAFLDLDRFKNVNDSLGHDAGDELLVEVARKLESVIRPGDTVARFGGDEFTVLCEDLPERDGPRADGRDRRSVAVGRHPAARRARYRDVRGRERRDRDWRRRARSVRRSCSAMPTPRCTTPRRRAAAGSRSSTTPCAPARSRRTPPRTHCTGRWSAASSGSSSSRSSACPTRAASVPRRWCVGSIRARSRARRPSSSRWPRRPGSSCRSAGGCSKRPRATRRSGSSSSPEPFQVSVNLSARQLAQPDLADRVAEVIAETGVRPSSLCFEITESVLMDDAETVLDVITRVRELGVQFAIDDFGTGYSSLGYLKRFPVDSVKIDRSFVTGLGSDPGDAAIVSAVIGLAHALGLRVTAEGVETQEQLAALIALECDEAQGYFFSPPQPAPDLRSLIRVRTGATGRRVCPAPARRSG